MTVVAMSSLFSFQSSSSTVCRASVGAQAFWWARWWVERRVLSSEEAYPKASSYSQTRHLLVSTFGPLWFDFQVPTSPPMPPSKIGWHFLPQLVFKITHSLEEREIACS